MMDNDSRGRLFRLQLKLFRKTDIDPGGIQQREKFLLVLESRTGRIAETVTRTLILLMKQARQDRRVTARDAEFFTHVFVPVFGERLRRFHAQTVKVQVVRIIV
jgi:hypothetical protein